MTLWSITKKRIAQLWIGLFIFVIGCETHEDVTPSSQSSPSPISTPLNTQPCLLTSILIGSAEKYNYLYTSDNRLSEIQHVLYGLSTPLEQWTMGYTNGQLTTISYYSGSATGVPELLYTFEYGPNNKPSKLTQTQGTYLFGTTTYTYDTQDRLVMGVEIYGAGALTFTIRYEYDANNNVSKKYINQALAAVHHTYDNRERYFAASPDLTLVEIYLFNYDPSVNNLIVSTAYIELTSYGGETIFQPYSDQTFEYAFDQSGYITSITGPFENSWLFTFSGATYSCK